MFKPQCAQIKTNVKQLKISYDYILYAPWKLLLGEFGYIIAATLITRKVREVRGKKYV